MAAVMVHVQCNHCGTKMECPDTVCGKNILCHLCTRPVYVPTQTPIPDKIELETPPLNVQHIDTEAIFARGSGAAPQSPSVATPAAAPTQAKDPDKALTNVALGMLRLQNWPCQEEPGYRSFKMTVRFKTPTRGVVATDSFRVFAEGGILFIEQLVLELPPLPGTPLLEAINEINLRSVSSVFWLCKEGVMMRQALIPRSVDDGFFTSRMLMQALRQMYHDRRHALSLLRQVVETRIVDPIVVATAFEHALAPNNIAGLWLDQLADLASFGGYHVHRDEKQIYLSREAVPPERCPLRMTANSGFIRGWVMLGDVVNGKDVWTFVPPKLRTLIKGKPASTKNAELYERINTLNQTRGLLRFVVAMRSIAAVAQAFPTDQNITIEQLTTFVDTLLEHSSTGTKQESGPVRKLAC